MNRHDRDRLAMIVAPDHRIPPEPVVNIKATCPLPANSQQAAIITKRSLHISMRQQISYEAAIHSTLGCAYPAMLTEHSDLLLL
jgi:hypothetical protein